MVEFDQQIHPGQTGRIGLSVKVYPSWAGKSFKKTAVVYTNDPNNGKFFLTLKGEVKPVPGQKRHIDEPDGVTQG